MSSTKIEEFKADVHGGSVYIKRWTPENTSTEPPIILLHDSLGSVDLWRDFPLLLAKTLSRPVVAYDRLGFGKSDAREKPPSMKFIQEEATKYFPLIKEHLAIHHYALFGHSVGGGMAIHTAAHDPDCEAVVSVSAQAFIEDRTIDGLKKAKQMFKQAGQIERLEKWHGPKARWVLNAWFDVWLSPDFSNWSLQPAISNVHCPILAIHGENDEYGSSAFPEFISQNAGGQAEVLLLKDCGHMPHKEKTKDVINAVKTFISDYA